MAIIYVKSGSSNTSPFDTWAKAATTLAGAAGADAAGDTIYLSDAHSESSASAQTIALAGTLADPVRVICGDDAAEPPTAVATTASVLTTGANGITTYGIAEFYGVKFSAGSGAVNAPITINTYSVVGNSRERFEDCEFLIPASGSGASIRINNNGAASNAVNCRTDFANCFVETKTTSGNCLLLAGLFVWDGGGLKSGQASSSAALIAPISTAGRTTSCELSGLDFQYMGSGQAMFAANNTTAKMTMRNCRLPSGWSGSLVSGTLTAGDYYVMHNCDDGDTNYALWVQTYAGTILSEDVIVRTGGASNGTTTISWRMAAGGDVKYPTITLESPEIVQWNETTGSSITATIEVVHDSVGSGTSGALTNAECWLEVQYLGTSGVPLGTFDSDVKADILASAADQTSSSETWTTTGLTTPVKQKLSVTFTPQEKGYVHAVVKFAIPSETVYVDPKLTIA